MSKELLLKELEDIGFICSHDYRNEYQSLVDQGIIEKLEGDKDLFEHNYWYVLKGNPRQVNWIWDDKRIFVELRATK